MFFDHMEAKVAPLLTAVRTHGALKLWFLTTLELEMLVNTALVSVGPAALSADKHLRPTRSLLTQEQALH